MVRLYIPVGSETSRNAKQTKVPTSNLTATNMAPDSESLQEKIHLSGTLPQSPTGAMLVEGRMPPSQIYGGNHSCVTGYWPGSSQSGAMASVACQPVLSATWRSAYERRPWLWKIIFSCDTKVGHWFITLKLRIALVSQKVLPKPYFYTLPTTMSKASCQLQVNQYTLGNASYRCTVSGHPL